MSQYNPQAQQGGGGRGGGRGYQGRGGGPQQGRPMGAWQPSAPTSSLQQAAYGRQTQQGGYHHHNQHHHNQHHHNQHHHNNHNQHPNAGPPHGGPPGQFHAPHHYNPYAQQGPYRGPQPGPGGWYGHPPQGGVFYPPASGMPGAAAAGTAAGAPVVQPPKPREKKLPVITDKHGNVLDFRSESAQKKSSLKAAVAAERGETAGKSNDAGSKLREAALARINEKDTPASKSEDTTKPNETPKEEDKAPATTAPTPTPPPPAEEAKKEEPVKKEEKPAPPPQPEASAPKPAAASPAPAPEPSKPEVTPEERPKPEITPEETPKPVTPQPAAVVEPPAPAPAKEEKKEEPPKTRTLADIAASAPAPAKPASAAATVKSGGSSLAAAASKKPNMAAVAAAPAPAPVPSPSKAPPVGLRPGGKTRAAPAAPSNGRVVYDKKALLKFKSNESCLQRPESLPDMTIVKGPAKAQGGGGGGNSRGGRDNNRGGGGGWGQQGRRNSQRNNNNNNNNNNNSGDWERGQAPPRNQKGRGGGRRGSQNNVQPMYEGPVAPLVKSENRWKPSKNTSPLVAAEKQVKSILNKMTKEKFDRLSAQMIDIQILSYDMLTMMIHNVYEKAIDEPSFGDMYADLCVKLSKGAAQANNDFVKVIESDEEPPTEGDAAPTSQESASSSHVVYRWSNDVSTTDDEVVGPFESADACIDAALGGSGEPQKRGEMKLVLEKLIIKKGVFVKVMKKKDASEGAIFYTVYFAVDEADDCGQQLSEIFLSEVECVSNAKKKNSFKRSLLNKCEDEFKKQGIYDEWKKEKQEFDESKGKLASTEAREKEEELEFRRIKIKKQVLGNVKFIGQLYKATLIKEKIVRYCIGSLLKLRELTELKTKNPEYEDTGDFDIEEEDHEAICSMFTTIGLTIDQPSAADFMKVCFTKIHTLSLDKKNLPARSRFMYKDLLELRDNRWVPRRDEGKAKSLEEIRKDFEREEKKQAQQSQQNYRSDQRDNRRGSQQTGGRGYTGRGGGGGGNRNRQNTRQQQETDDDGFTVIGRGGNKGQFQVGGGGGRGNKQQQSIPNSGSKSNFAALNEGGRKSPNNNSSAPAPAPLSPEKLERRIKSIRAEYMQDPSNEAELLLSMDELRGTENAGLTLVTKSMDVLVDGKEAERRAVTAIFRILFEKNKLSKENIRSGLDEFIEFIDAMVCDAPKLYEYVGDLLGVMFQLKVVDVQWLCESLEKTKLDDPDSPAPEKLTRATISSIRSNDGPGSAKDIFGKSSSSMNTLLGADKWSSISNDLLG